MLLFFLNMRFIILLLSSSETQLCKVCCRGQSLRPVRGHYPDRRDPVLHWAGAQCHTGETDG